MSDKFFGSEKFARVLSTRDSIQCIDVGARGALKDDLFSLAPAIELYGFEPDKAECERLNNLYSSGASLPYRKILFFPVAIGQKSEKRTLFITKHKGASSLLSPIAEIGSQFLRNDYVTIESTCEIATIPLDEFLATNSLSNVAHAKIDVEGAELEVLQSATQLLSSTLLSLRVEVSFLRTRIGQPCYSDIEAYLRKYNFIPMDFLELHHWRRMTKKHPSKRDKGVLPYSKGQVAHGDMLFFLNPEHLLQRPLEFILKSALIAMAFGYIDHAYYLITNSSAKKYLEDTFHMSLEKEFAIVSEHFHIMHNKSTYMEFFRQIFRKRR